MPQNSYHSGNGKRQLMARREAIKFTAIVRVDKVVLNNERADSDAMGIVPASFRGNNLPGAVIMLG